MGKIPAWKEKVWKAKFHEGYADVLYEDVWSLDTRLARIIANHLRAFCKQRKGHMSVYQAVLLKSTEQTKAMWNG